MKIDLNCGGWKKPPCIVEDYVLSHTGRYWGFYGYHFHAGIKCWVVGAVNTESGETTTRHYNEKETVNATLAKHEASEAWEELKAGLKRAPTEEERKTDERLLEAWEEAARRSAESAKRGSLPN
jgi:hypothetical protein